MYERNAIVIDRYFASIFGYDSKNNLKNNSSNYFELVSNLEKYQQASETENNIMEEFDKVASQIKETQKYQEVLNKRNLKYCENRKNLFESLDEEPENLRKKFDKIEEEINKNNEEIKINSEKFIEEIRDFNEKSETRSICGRERRNVENDYQKILNSTIDNFSNINKEKLKEAKNFIKTDNKKEAKNSIKEKILKNGSKEKVPFDENAINTAIDTSTYIEEKKAEILLSLYDKTMRLLVEIKNDNVKIEKHKKIVKDSKSKLELLNVISEYIILFLDNERMNTMGGEEEHKKVMNEACSNLQSDLVEIQNMYSLLIKEITGKSSKKAYKELYNIQYLIDLQDEEKKFEKSISQLNMIGTVIYPDYWRVEGMQKIYETFKTIITEEYEKDLSEFEPLDITFEVNEEMLEEDNEDNENDSYLEEVDEKINEIEELESNIKNDEDIEQNEKKVQNDDKNDKEDNPIIPENIIDDEEFHWDDEDEEELNFGTSFSSNPETDEDENYIEESEEIEDEEEENIEEKQDENETDKEVDEILGIFDTDVDDIDIDKEEPLNIEVDDEDDRIFEEEIDDLEDKIIEEEEQEQEEPKEEEKDIKKTKKRKGLFARRKK